MSGGVRILHLVPGDGIGGVEVAARSMLARDDLPCTFRLLFISPAASPSLWRRLRDNVRAFGEARSFDPHVIVCSLWRSVPLALALRLACRRAKLAFFIHNDITMHALDTALSGLAIRLADQVWGDSEATLAARRIAPERGRTISFVTERLAAPERTPSPKVQGRARFASWGRLTEQKGIDRAIRLIALLAEQGLDVRYDAYGPDGGALAALETQVRDLKLKDRVRFPGPVPRSDLPAIAAGHDYYLQLSRSEGMCMAAVEAMQLGLVPVATAVGQMAHYVVPGETGVIVDVDRLEQGARDVAALVADPDAWVERSRAAQRYWRQAPLYADDVCRAATELAR